MEEVQALLENPTIKTIICYTDAAYSEQGRTALAWHIANTKMTRTKDAKHCRTAQEAEITAIAEALKEVGKDAQCDTHIMIYTDSQEAIRSLKTHQETCKAVRDIMTMAIELRMRNVKTSVHWIPGHEGIEGNELANEAAGEFNRSILPCLNCSSEASAFTLDPATSLEVQCILESREGELSGFYDPVWEIMAAKTALKKKIDRHKEIARESLPKGFRRHETVLLRRLQADAAVTPSATKKWHDMLREENTPTTTRNQTSVSAA